MRILYLTALNLDERSGAVEHVNGIKSGLEDLGHRVSLLGLGSPPPGRSARLAIPPTGAWARNIGMLKRAAEAETSGDDAPDVIYVRSFPLDYFVVLREFVKRRIPFVLELNTVLSREYRAEGKGLRAALYGLAERPALAASIGWLGVTNEILQEARRRAHASRPTAIALNGFSPCLLGEYKAACDARSELGVRRDARVLLMASFGRPWHGADRAMAMLHHLPDDTELWLVGAKSKAQTKGLLRLADPSVRSRVRFWPWLSGDDFARVLTAADLGLGPLALDRNDMREAQPMKVRMYLGTGLPVLQNYIDPALESAGSFVRRVESTDPAQLANAALSMLQLPPSERKNAGAFARRNLTWEAAAKTTSRFLEGLLSGSCGGGASDEQVLF
jgi:glycosyltransferase involved in cell wall biosynthesis